MKITKIEINNFKSIEKLEFDIKKYGDSYTSIFVGINESGKSNILKAFSYLDIPHGPFNFDNLSNQKNEEDVYVDLYYSLEFQNTETYLKTINDDIEYEEDFKFEIYDIRKNVYLKKGETEFKNEYEFEIKLPKKKYFFAEKTINITVSGRPQPKKILHLFKDNDETNSRKELTDKDFSSFFNTQITDIIKKYEPKVSYWTPSNEYLLSEVNLITYKANPNSNKPLKNIFALAGYNGNEKILEQIDKIANSRYRSKLTSKLNEALNNYLDKVWDHEIDTVIDITETGQFSLSFKDKGEENKHDRFSIDERSEGAKHFISLILSLSLESKSNIRENELILIDEPEVHLHPSGVRDLSNELLNIGKKNYVFIATHSPFLIDKKNKERHFIIKKNKKAITEKREIKGDENLIDDEVLREAFGIEVFKDLLNPHSLIVEGCSDKVILQKAFNLLDKKNIGITNGHGSNIDTLASKLNHNDISIIVVVDDDDDGKKYKRNIIKIGGIYDNTNVFTIRDLVGESISNCTIEDLLDVNYIKAEFIKMYKSVFTSETDFEVDEEKPILEQIIIYLKKHKKYSEWDMDLFKKNISENFKPTKASLKEKNPLLKAFAENIIEKMKI